MTSGKCIFLFCLFLGSQGASVEVSKISKLSTKYGDTFQEHTECGGVIEASAGVINYKLNQNTTAEEVCIWTIFAARKESFKIQMLEDGFFPEVTCTACQRVTVFNRSTYHLEKAFYIGPKDRTEYIVNGGSFLQLAFSSSDSPYTQGTGFSLVFEGIGDIPNDLAFVIFDEPKTSSGTISYPKEGATQDHYEYVSFTIHPEEGKRVALTLTYLTNPIYDQLYEECSKDRNTFVITEVAHGASYPYVRFRECRDVSNTTSTTIYSPRPLVVTYLTYSIPHTFQLDWNMI